MNNKKDFWDKISVLTTFFASVLIAAIGLYATHIYNSRQLDIARIEALDKLRPLLLSENSADREFGYRSFVALGYEELAIKMISLSNDLVGADILTQLSKSNSDEIKYLADNAINKLDNVIKVVNIFEYGEGNNTQHEFKAELDSAKIEAFKNKIKTPLGLAIIYDAIVQVGMRKYKVFVGETLASLKSNTSSSEYEKEWLETFLYKRKYFLENHNNPIVRISSYRVKTLLKLVQNENWDLKSPIEIVH